MIITNVSVRKIEKDDPRYPDTAASPKFTDCYLCQCISDSGEAFEAAFFVLEDRGPLTPQGANSMMKVFGASIERLAKDQAA